MVPEIGRASSEVVATVNRDDKQVVRLNRASSQAVWNTLAWSLLVLAALLPIGLLSWYSFRIASESIRRLVQANNEAAAEVTAELVSRDLERSRDLARTIAALPGMIDIVERQDAEGVRVRLQKVVETSRGIDRMFVTDVQGELWSDYPPDPKTIGQNFAHRDWYRGFSRGWKPYVSEVYQRAAQPKPLVVAIAVPIQNAEGQVLAAMVTQYRLEGVTEWLKQINIGTRLDRTLQICQLQTGLCRGKC